ncbi:TetR/AcrR family transcriptional regulator [Dendrosporobacter sp. 1207_IL3150]|uniref:TetR/AcrR family transcriptional regulator n=1 Tax=Dendrosporobacter sp. 1207_IL3150 TaxID=3084054 RepID=UPI002FDB8D60
MRNRIMLAAMTELNERGIKFTMDDLARQLGVSKRTLYENFSSKEELIGFLLTEVTAELKAKREAILYDNQLDVREKFKQIMTVRSTIWGDTADQVSLDIKKCMPHQWKKIEKSIDELWEIIDALLSEGKQKGVFRPVFFPAMRVMFRGSFHEFANYAFLLQNRVTVKEMINYMVDILMYGIVVQQQDKPS